MNIKDIWEFGRSLANSLVPYINGGGFKNLSAWCEVHQARKDDGDWIPTDSSAVIRGGDYVLISSTPDRVELSAAGVALAACLFVVDIDLPEVIDGLWKEIESAKPHLEEMGMAVEEHPDYIRVTDEYGVGLVRIEFDRIMLTVHAVNKLNFFLGDIIP